MAVLLDTAGAQTWRRPLQQPGEIFVGLGDFFGLDRSETLAEALAGLPGNHVACAAAMANLDEIERLGLVSQAGRVGSYLLNKLNEAMVYMLIAGATSSSSRRPTTALIGMPPPMDLPNDTASGTTPKCSNANAGW